MSDDDIGRGGSGTGDRGGRESRRPLRATEDPANIRLVAVTTCPPGGPKAWRSASKVRELLAEQGIRFSKSTIVTLQERAVSSGLIVPYLNLPEEVADAVRLESALRVRFGLRNAVVIPGSDEFGREMARENRTHLRGRFAVAVAERISSMLDPLVCDLNLGSVSVRGKQHLVMGVAWGTTLRAIADWLLLAKRPQRPTMQVLPIIGVTAALQTESVEANTIAMDFARAYGAQSAQLPAPAFVTAREEEALRSVAPVAQVLETLGRCDVVVTGIGPILERLPQGESLEDIKISNDDGMNEKIINGARGHGAIAEICGVFFDRDGRAVRAEYNAMGIGYDTLARAARDEKRHVVLIGGGDRRRVAPLRVALDAGLASVVVTDSVTARLLTADGDSPAVRRHHDTHDEED